MSRKTEIIWFGIASFIMGAAVGAVVWAALKIMEAGIQFLWEILPEQLGITAGNPVGMLGFETAVCAAGGILIGLWQKKNGIFPEPLEEVLAKVKKQGGYAYEKMPVLLVSALLPLVFGGAVGPEAGLTGVIAGFCTLIGDRLKYKGDRVKEMTDAGTAAVLGVIFHAPLFGILEHLEPKDWGHADSFRKKRRPNEQRGMAGNPSAVPGRPFAPPPGRERLLSRAGRTVICVIAVIGAMLALRGLSAIFGGMAGLPRFDNTRAWSMSAILMQWKWALPLMLVGIAAAGLYQVFFLFTQKIGEKLYQRRIVSCVAAGLALAAVGHFVTAGRFSGENQLDGLITGWQGMSVRTLLLFGVIKLLMVNVSVNLGWKGGTIFSMVYSSAAFSYAASAVIGTGSVESTFAAAIVTASMMGVLIRKPITVAAVLLLCFPPAFLPALLIAAFISAWLGRQFGK